MMPSAPDNIIDKSITASQLAYYLFGNPLDSRDIGIIGRMEQRVDKLTRLAWAIVLMIFTAVLALVADLIVSAVMHVGVK